MSRRGYRPDIDGLRALAVAVVVLYHFDVPPFSGGYIGVDVFFVISGYLITAIVLADLQTGRFSLRHFYERRARRILPALFAVMVATAVAAYVLFIPADFVDFAKSVAATVAFASNILFNEQSGYFSPAADLKPLLHTWSLAIEEQFYVLHPLFLIVLFRLGWLPAGVALALAISFAISVYSAIHHPTAAFYLLPSRAWELSAGAALAIGVLKPAQRALSASAVGLAGLTLILWSAITFAPQTPFPGAAALAPVVGTALLIWSGTHPQALAARLLSARVLVGLGLVSYSLYLWHWPALVFSQYTLVRPLHGHEALLVLACTLGVSVLTYRYVELPFRNSQGVPLRRLVHWAIAASVAGTSAAAVVIGSGGLPARMRPEVLQALALTPERIAAPCLPADAVRLGNGNIYCARGKSQVLPTFVLAGDSHASAMAPAFFRTAEAVGLSGYQVIGAGFIPLPGVFAPKHPTWSQLMPDFVELLRRNPTVRRVVLIGYWEMRADGTSTRFKRIEFRDAGYDGTGATYNQISLRRGLERLIDMFPDRTFALIEGVPTGLEFDPSVAVRLIHLYGDTKMSSSYGIDRSAYELQTASYRPIFADLALRPNVVVLPVADHLCGGEFCSGWRDNKPIYIDSNHLTETGAALLDAVFRAALGYHSPSITNNPAGSVSR
jgi:peptidoglycan/LPS O-acetylase OafA/YrhL